MAMTDTSCKVVEIQFRLRILLSSFLCVVLQITWIHGIDITSALPVTEMPVPRRCCNGTLGYATSDVEFTIVCSEMICCNSSETVAVIPVDIALGFTFRCMPRSDVRPLCYQAGVEVRSSNEDPDHTPRVCCQDAKFNVILHKWYAAMVVKCVAR